MKWKDDGTGRWSELSVIDDERDGGLLVRHIYGSAWQPHISPASRSWETHIALRSSGHGLSLESSKVDAVMALRRDAELIVKALGGKVVWE